MNARSLPPLPRLTGVGARRRVPLLVALALLAVLPPVLGPAGPPWVPAALADAQTNLLFAGFGVLALAGARRRRTARAGWTLLGVALLVHAGANVLWTVLGRPVLSVADAAFGAMYVMTVVALVLVMKSRVPPLSTTIVADALLSAVTIGALLAAFVLPALTGDLDGPPAAVLVNMMYPLGDLTVLSVIVAGLSVGGRRADRGLVLMAIGGVMWCVADVLYLLAALEGAATGVQDGLWIVACALYAGAAWAPDPPEEPVEESAGRRRGLAVTALATVAAVVLVMQAVSSGWWWTAAAAALVIVLTVGRTMLFALEARALTGELRAAEARAARDPLTGLYNHRAFHERLAQEVERARRDQTGLGLVLVDIDHFKSVNDAVGHQAGDRVIAQVATRLAEVSRTGDIVARIGGEEFAWIIPGADDDAAWTAAERARETIAGAQVPGVGRVTISGGVSDLRHAGTASDLFRLADGALYWAKANGRDVVYRYDPGVVTALSAVERVEQLARNQALGAVRMLARAVDAKDPYTRGHSERVGMVAVQIATALGWSVERTIELQEAAMVHDVGKIGVPDAILRKEGRLSAEEFAEMRKHPVLGADLVREVLTPEQTAWVRGHHERVDGRGYPDGLDDDTLSDGARILAVADAWDAMTSTRPYRPDLTSQEALRAIRGGRGTQFCPRVADVLDLLVRADALLDNHNPVPAPA